MKITKIISLILLLVLCVNCICSCELFGSGVQDSEIQNGDTSNGENTDTIPPTNTDDEESKNDPEDPTPPETDDPTPPDSDDPTPPDSGDPTPPDSGDPTPPDSGDEDDEEKEEPTEPEAPTLPDKNTTELCVLNSTTAKISSTQINDCIEVGLTDSQSNALLVRLPVDGDWNTVLVKQGDDAAYVKTHKINGVTLADFNVIPNSENAKVTPVILESDKALTSNYGVVLSNGTKIDTNYYPGFVRKAVTFTIDDGRIDTDTKFLQIVRPAGIIGTFNLNHVKATTASGYLALYDGYEIASHHELHALPFRDPADFYTRLSFDSLVKNEIFNSSTADVNYVYKTSTEGLYYINYHYYSESYIGKTAWHAMATDELYIEYAEITKDKLEAVFGKGSVVGFAYPFGVYNEVVKQYLKDAGYLYARKTGTLKDSTGFALPTDRYAWTYNADVSSLLSVMEKYDALADDGELKLFSFGVHSLDFDGKWNVLEEFAAKYGNRPDDFYYATNRAIFEYEDAVKALDINESRIINDSDVAVFITVNNEKVIIPANSVYYLDGSVGVKVTFDCDNDTEATETFTAFGETVASPTTIPAKNGFVFDGWYLGEEKFDFSTNLTESVTLVAKYTPEKYTEPSAEVLDVKDGASGIVVIVHDDGRVDSGLVIDDLLYKYKLNGNVAMIVSNIYNTTTETVKADYNTWQKLVNTGRWSVISHSYSHSWWGEEASDGNGNSIAQEDADKMLKEVVVSQQILRNLFEGQRVLTFAYPGFSSLVSKYGNDVIYSEALFNLVRESYISARQVGSGTWITTTKDNDWNYLEAYWLSPDRIYGTDNSGLEKTLDNIASFGLIKIISMHAVSRDVKSGEYDGYTLSATDVEYAFKLISERVENGEVWNTSYENAILYVREAQTASVSVSGNSERINLALTDEMDNEIYNFPLTVRVSIPGEWNAAKITQGTSVSYATAKYTDGKWVVDANVIPDGGECVIEPIDVSDIPYQIPTVQTPPLVSYDDSDVLGYDTEKVPDKVTPTISSNGGSLNISSIETENGEERVLNFTTAAGANDYIVFTQTRKAYEYNAIAFETRLMIDTQNSLVFEIEPMSGSKRAYKITVNTGSDGSVKISGADFSAIKVANKGEWFSIRVEYTSLGYDCTDDGKDDILVKIYINDSEEPVAVGYTPYEPTCYNPADVTKVRIFTWSSSSGNIYFDDTLFEQFTMGIDAPPSTEPDQPELPDEPELDDGRSESNPFDETPGNGVASGGWA